VYSVTSEAATSMSFQTAAPKPARPDASQGNDSFGTLVDSSMPANTGNDASAPTPQPPSAAPRPSDHAAASPDNTGSRNAAAADRTASNDSADNNAAAQQVSEANASANPDAVLGSRTKSGFAKAGAAKSSEKPSSEKVSTPAAALGQPAAPPATTPNPVAVAIPVASAPTNSPAAPPPSGNATAPLAIAAAAIAANSPAAAAPAAGPAQINIDSDATAPAADVATTAATAASATTAKFAVQAAASQAATPVTQPVTPTAASEVALTAAVAATAPVAPKATLLKTPATGPAKTAAGATDANPGKPDPSASAKPAEAATGNATQQPAAAGKQAGNDLAGDGAAGASSTTSPAAPAAHDHSPVAGAEHASADPSDTGVQATGTVPPQLPSAPAAAVVPLSVAVATNAPVPLSGLAIEIAASVKSGKSSFEIRLDPADLGRIDVRIDVDRNGQVTSHLTVEKPETLSMLRQDAPQLQQALDDAGFKTADGGLQFSLRDQSSSGQNGGSETGRNAQRLVISDDDTIPAAVAGRTYGRTLGSSSGVDIRV
jgi:flagellar hook-length control protein FliK